MSARPVICNFIFQVVGSVKVASLFLLFYVILRTRYTFIMRKCHLDFILYWGFALDFKFLKNSFSAL